MAQTMLELVVELYLVFATHSEELPLRWDTHHQILRCYNRYIKIPEIDMSVVFWRFNLCVDKFVPIYYNL